MLREACGELLRMRNVVVINDEAHHPTARRSATRTRRWRAPRSAKEAKDKEAARLWISGIEALDRKVGVRAVYDLSATPFFLKGSGYRGR